MEKTFGERLVRTDFNAGNSDKVAECKQNFAKLINEMNAIREAAWNNADEAPTTNDNQERGRCASIAITKLETAAMYAVKALTV